MTIHRPIRTPKAKSDPIRYEKNMCLIKPEYKGLEAKFSTIQSEMHGDGVDPKVFNRLQQIIKCTKSHPCFKPECFHCAVNPSKQEVHPSHQFGTAKKSQKPKRKYRPGQRSHRFKIPQGVQSALEKFDDDKVFRLTVGIHQGTKDLNFRDHMTPPREKKIVVEDGWKIFADDADNFDDAGDAGDAVNADGTDDMESTPVKKKYFREQMRAVMEKLKKDHPDVIAYFYADVSVLNNKTSFGDDWPIEARDERLDDPSVEAGLYLHAHGIIAGTGLAEEVLRKALKEKFPGRGRISFDGQLAEYIDDDGQRRGGAIGYIEYARMEKYDFGGHLINNSREYDAVAMCRAVTRARTDSHRGSRSLTSGKKPEGK